MTHLFKRDISSLIKSISNSSAPAAGQSSQAKEDDDVSDGRVE